MSQAFVVVERPSDWKLSLPEDVRIVTPREYLTEPSIQKLRRARVFNLCREYAYQSAGYYVSLLAEARGHRPLPSVATLRNLHGRPPLPSTELNQLIQHSLADIQSDAFTLSIYFSHNLAKRHDRLARALFNLFPAPLLRAQFGRAGDGTWRLRSLGPIPARDIPPQHAEFVAEAAGLWLRHPSAPQRPRQPRYTMAVLVDPEDKTSPSDAGALKAFVRAAARQRIAVEFIGPEDLGSVAEYDALFIRMTTSVENVTFRFARRAASEGIPVIDDPDSILRCTNKVFLAELFQRHGIPAPDTRILYRGAANDPIAALGLPLVLKQPDSSFSQGVVKVETVGAFEAESARLFRESELLIAQAFMPTGFDWRIGILDRAPLFACRYHMARGHWQIYKSTSKPGVTLSGASDTLPIDEAPPSVVRVALDAANLVGDGLYGVDLKEVDGHPLVIEINDNPSIDHRIEDAVLGDELYDRIVSSFVARIERRTAPPWIQG